MAGPRGLAGGPCEPWLWLAALQGSVCFVGRAALCLRLLYHKTLSTGTKTRGKSGSCLKKHPEFRKRFRAFFRKNNSPWETQSGFLRHGEAFGSGETFRNREDPAVLFRLQTPLGKRGRFYRQYGRGRGIRGGSRSKGFEILRKVNFVPLGGRILANPHERWIFEESFGEFPGCCSGNPVSNQCFT